MGVESGLKGGLSSVKSHWIFFAIAIVVVVGLALKYERTHAGAISSKLAGLPLVGGFFA